jgi:hypothetical protein
MIKAVGVVVMLLKETVSSLLEEPKIIILKNIS